MIMNNEGLAEAAAINPTTLWNKWNAVFESMFMPSRRRIYLGIFRVYISFHIIKKLLFQWPYLKLLYGKGSFMVWSESIYGIVSNDIVKNNYLAFACIYFALAMLMGFGIGKRYTVALLYLVQEMWTQTQGFVMDGGDNLLKFGVLYLILTNSFECLSISKISYRRPWQRRLDNLCTNVGVGCIIAHLLLAYFISGTAKLHADVWYHGTATYYCLNIDRFHGTLLNERLVQSSLFVALSTYFVMIWETTFPFCVFNRHLRILYLLAGVMVHLGIYIFMMINAFQIYFLAHYGFFFTDSELRRFKQRWIDPWLRRSPKPVLASEVGAGQ